MAKKEQQATPTITAVAPESTPIKTTKPRNTSVPPRAKASPASSGAAPTVVTSEMIAERAYHLWKSGSPGGEMDHWIAAERELNR